MQLRNIALTAAGVLGAAAMAAPAQAITFADYGAVDSGVNMTFTGSSTGGTLSAGAQTLFDFLTLGSAYQDLSATYTFSATSTTAPVSAGGYDIQPGLDGSFSFTYDGPTTGSFTTGENLLSGTFTGASLAGPDSGSTASAQDSIVSGGTVTFASDVLTFPATGDKGISIELTSVLPGLFMTRGGGIADFTGVSTGSFASDISSGGGGGGVPEPASWALMLLGFAGIGAARRLTLSAQRRTLA